MLIRSLRPTFYFKQTTQKNLNYFWFFFITKITYKNLLTQSFQLFLTVLHDARSNFLLNFMLHLHEIGLIEVTALKMIASASYGEDTEDQIGSGGS